jgi:DNA-binding XRE family transcriptional regulator
MPSQHSSTTSSYNLAETGLHLLRPANQATPDFVRCGHEARCSRTAVQDQDHMRRREAGGCPGPRRVGAIVSVPPDSVHAMTLSSSDQLVWRCISRCGGYTEAASFSALLRRLRQGAALSQQELAERIGTTQSAVARLESGSAQPKLATLSKLAEALGENLHIHINGRIDQ